jgi:hypothetical protein
MAMVSLKLAVAHHLHQCNANTQVHRVDLRCAGQHGGGGGVCVQPRVQRDQERGESTSVVFVQRIVFGVDCRIVIEWPWRCMCTTSSSTRSRER